MRVWTIQPLDVWESLQRRRRLQVCPNSPKYRGYIPPAYQWLQQQLGNRMAGYMGHLPWWVYGRKPDLRQHRHLLTNGATGVRLELELAAGCCLTFPCWAWQHVFCQDYLAFSPQEYDQWQRRLQRAVPYEDTWPLPQPWRSRLEASWERLFAPGLPRLSWDQNHEWSRTPCVEGVVEVLRLDDVRCATEFKGTLELDFSKPRPAGRSVASPPGPASPGVCPGHGQVT